MNAKWKRLVTAILMMALLLGPIVSMQTPARAADGEDDNTFIVGFDAEFPPYGYKDDNGEYVGFDLDLAQEVCDRNGWTLKKQPIEWNSKDMELNSGSISCIWNGFTMNGREDAYTWTTPYVDNSQVVVVRKDSGITQLTDLSGKVVAVQADSSALAALTGEDASEENKALAETFKELQQVGDYNSAFMNLESGAVNAICMDIGVANYEIASRGDKFVMLEDRLSSEEYGIGFKLGNTELRDKVQATLLDMLADGTFEEIAEKWGLEESICLSPDDQVHDSYVPLDPPNRKAIPVEKPEDVIGTPYIPCDLDRLVAVVPCDITDKVRPLGEIDEDAQKMGKNLVEFFKSEVAAGRLPANLLPLQSGVGSVANAVINGLVNSDFEDLTVYTEVIQDGMFDLIDAGKLRVCSGTALSPSPDCLKKFYRSEEHTSDSSHNA